MLNMYITNNFKISEKKFLLDLKENTDKSTLIGIHYKSPISITDRVST